MSNELRYLLHGNKEKYEDVTTPLYVTSQESTVWQKVGQQVLHRKNEDWRLLDPMLVEHIISSKHQALGIKLLQSEEVINLIRELKANCVDGSLLKLSERYELLRYISQRPANENLWKELRLHEATNGELVCIEAGRTYLESPDFPLDEQLQEYIVLIRRNTQEINQDWIPLWSPNLAIATILNRPNPHEYYKLIVDALERMSPQEREQCRVNLKNANWLPIRAAGRGVSPLDILKLPKNLVKHEHVIVSLDSTKYPESELPSSVHTSMAYMWIARLFTSWDAETVIRKVLMHSDKPPRYWSDFCAVILDAVQGLEIPKDLEVELKTQKWLLLGDRQIALEQVIKIVPKPLEQYLSALVDLSADEYTESSKLPDAVKNHQSLSRLFSRWEEEHVIDFILRQREPYKHLDITLKALSILVRNPHPKIRDNDDQLRLVAWLADAQGNPVCPQDVIYYPSLQDEIKGLLLTVSCSYVGASQLAKQIRTEESCWEWLTTKLFITQDKALVKVGELFKQAPEYQLGSFQIDEFPLDGVLEVFDKIDVSFLPAWNFAKQIYSKEKFKQYLLPNLLGQIDENKIVTILQRLAPKDSQSEETTVDVFNRYLTLAVQYNRFRQEILGQIHLLNRRREWKTPDKLTWGNRDNIDGAYVLDSKQAEIMRPYLNSLDINSTVLETSAITAVDETNFSVLQTYFRAWNQHCPSEPIGAFLSLLHGGDGRVKNLAHSYLGQRDLGITRQRLFENQPIPTRVFRIYVGQASDLSREVLSVLGHTFTASLASTQDLPHLFVSNLAPNVTELELIPIQPQDIPSDLTNLLRNSTRALLKEVYGVTSVSLNETWEDLLQSDQLDIQVAKNLLLDGALHVMRTLGAHEHSPLIKDLLTCWDKFRHQREELKQQHRPVENTNQKIDKLVSELSQLLEGKSSESEQVREQLLQAVRTKIDLYGYRCQSIPFELFQNADDAAIEWLEMASKQTLEEKRKQFVVVWTENKLLFIHAGRAIGCFQHSERPEREYRDRGFHRDLEKMLNLNISDKGKEVTGKFGLGFKSVYLACRRPYVLSKNLGFTVEGGIIPSRLEPQKTHELRENLQRYIGLADATIVELALEENVSCQNVLQDFLYLASILLVFSKGIKTCKFINNSHQEVTLSWSASPVLSVPEVETGKYQTKNGVESVLLCLRTGGEAEATLLLGIVEQNGRICHALPEDTPTFWVTAPTREKLFLGFVLNANFDITTGRESLVKSSARNRELAKRIGEALGEVLCSLFRASEGNWQALAEALGLTTADEYEFWSFLWEELAVGWQKKDPSEGIDVISQLLGGDRSMGYLIIRCQSLPSGLYGRHRQLISLNNVNYKVTGKLREQSCFLQVANWPSFPQHYQNKLIARDKWEEVKTLLGAAFDEHNYTVSDLRLLNVLKNEIGTNEPGVTPYQAMYIGNLISKEFFNSFSASSELSDIQSFLETVRFMSKADTYLPSCQLVMSSSSLTEEKLLAGFASDSRILHPDYKNTALDFFYACRSRRDSISIEELARWAIQAETDEQRKAVCVYLLQGEQREELAPMLYADRELYWFANHEGIINIFELMVKVVAETVKLTTTDEAGRTHLNFSSS